MEDKEIEEIVPVNDEAPPVPIIFDQKNNNINNINLNENNFNLFSNDQDLNIKDKNDENKNAKINIDNKNSKSKNHILFANNYLKNNYQPFLLKNQIYPSYNMMCFNYFQQQQKNNINNLNIPCLPNNNKNSININEKQIKDDSGLHDLKIDIELNALNLLNKENLIDIILFIHDFCKIKIEPKFSHIKHKIFRIRRDRNNDNGHLFFITKNNMIALLNQKNNDNNINEIISNNSDNNSDDNDEKNNIINEKNSNDIKQFENIEHKNNNLRYFYCEIHERVYFNINKKLHYMKHLKCNRCGAEFISKRMLKTHNRNQHQELFNNNTNNIKINNPEKNQISKQNLNSNINEDKIKCSDCNLIFNSVELMSEHYYKIHEKNKKEKELEQLKYQKEEKKGAEQIKIQEKEKKKEEENKKQKELKTIQFSNAQKEKLELFYYECYHDKQKFDTEKEYVRHFIKFHKNDFPFYCNICKRGFWAYESINAHSKAKGH